MNRAEWRAECRRIVNLYYYGKSQQMQRIEIYESIKYNGFKVTNLRGFFQDKGWNAANLWAVQNWLDSHPYPANNSTHPANHKSK